MARDVPTANKDSCPTLVVLVSLAPTAHRPVLVLTVTTPCVFGHGSPRGPTRTKIGRNADHPLQFCKNNLSNMIVIDGYERRGGNDANDFAKDCFDLELDHIPGATSNYLDFDGSDVYDTDEEGERSDTENWKGK